MQQEGLTFWGVLSNLFFVCSYLLSVHTVFEILCEAFPKRKVICFLGSFFWLITLCGFLIYFTVKLSVELTKDFYFQKTALHHFEPFEGVDEATFDILKKEKSQVDRKEEYDEMVSRRRWERAEASVRRRNQRNRAR